MLYEVQYNLNCESDFSSCVILFMNIPNVEINSVFSFKISSFHFDGYFEYLNHHFVRKWFKNNSNKV